MSTLWHFPPCSFFLNWLIFHHFITQNSLGRTLFIRTLLLCIVVLQVTLASCVEMGQVITWHKLWSGTWTQPELDLIPAQPSPNPGPTQPNFDQNLIQSWPKPMPKNNNRSDPPLFSKFKCSRAFQVGNLPQKKYPQTVIKLDRMSETRQKCQVDRS